MKCSHTSRQDVTSCDDITTHRNSQWTGTHMALYMCVCSVDIRHRGAVVGGNWNSPFLTILCKWKNGAGSGLSGWREQRLYELQTLLLPSFPIGAVAVIYVRFCRAIPPQGVSR
ncbi:hypothetical protein SRHO_G00002210 [Serrasalmus rhombeus]